uniref:Uncharacterized protein AlNc14C8G1093 n=1 Tax=Albugo laibachii Nc14 TaxID=890382 RepID=F0W217_9STRA|nr:conserved hypothetical protein [Albugo laibachii Nc14]|eukprot:CCA15096.1 conserved hypothetical protein [Albugo laibachii Nc14]
MDASVETSNKKIIDPVTPSVDTNSDATSEVAECQLQVGNSIDGTQYTVSLGSNAVAVQELRIAIARLCDIPETEQIILCGPPFIRLDAHKAIDAYGLPAVDKRIFVYDRRILSSKVLAPSNSRLLSDDDGQVEVTLSEQFASEGSRILSVASSPILRALAEYENQFLQQLHQSQLMTSRAESRYAKCQKALSELMVQIESIQAALSNLDTFKSALERHFDTFWAEYKETNDRHRHLLSEFEKYLSRLAQVKLHPALVKDHRKTLYDCVPSERERQWVQQCDQSSKYLGAQVDRLRSIRDEICEEADQLIRFRPNDLDHDYTATAEKLLVIRENSISQAKITSKMKQNLQSVVSRISATFNNLESSSMMYASTNALEICRGLDELHMEQQHDMIPNAERLDTEIKKQVEEVANAKCSGFRMVCINLRDISRLQSKIRDFEHSLAALKEAFLVQKSHFKELEHLEQLPDAYRACLREIRRRKRYGRKFSSRIQAMAEKLATLREEEVEHREIFLREYGKHLPRDFIGGMAEKPSHCEFRMQPFDQSLPDLIDNEEEGSLTKSNTSEDLGQSIGMSSNDSSFVTGNNSIAANGAEECEQDSSAMKDSFRRAVGDTNTGEECMQATVDPGGRSENGNLRDSFSPSDSGNSAIGDGSACEFPLVLALAATADEMGRNSTELDKNTPCAHHIRELENQLREKDDAVAKLESENQELLLRVASIEYELQAQRDREAALQQKSDTMQHSIQSFQHSLATQRSFFQKVSEELEISFDENQDLMVDDVPFCMKTLQAKVLELKAAADAEKILRSELEAQQDDLLFTDRDSRDSFKISFQTFDIGDLALFLPTSGPTTESQRRVYLAFHLGCPHRFLSEESISSFSTSGSRYPDYVIGRIVLIDEQIASESSNPYGLVIGTTFYILTVASLHESS